LYTLVRVVSRHRDGIEREPWATGRVSTSGTQWLDDHQGKHFHRSPWYSKVWTKINNIINGYILYYKIRKKINKFQK